jgi:RNA polymerase sigma-70 factor, ECF subfamily
METHDDTARFRGQVVSYLPGLRAYARFLTSKADLADDLVQDTAVRALSAQDQFKPGTNLRAWLYTILRNQHSTHRRSRRHLHTPIDQIPECLFQVPASQMATLEIRDLRGALMQLHSTQREALILVAAAGCSYEEAAEICGCALGTIKSRVNRARAGVARALLGTEQMTAPSECSAVSATSDTRSARDQPLAG